MSDSWRIWFRKSLRGLETYKYCDLFLSLFFAHTVVSNGNRQLIPMQYACRPLSASLQVFLQVASRCTKWPPVAAAERSIYRRWFRCVSGPLHGGRGGRCFAYPPLRRHFAYAAASACDWPGQVDGRTGGGGAHKELIQDDVNQAQLSVALREEGEVNYCAERNAHVQ